MTDIGTRIRYVEAFDGIRGLSLLAVLLFHSGFSWASGGFLGVSTFFTLSGFLIGSLLLEEWRNTGRIDLQAFWARRVRRLVPASLVTLLVLSASVRFWLRGDRLESFASDVLAAITYVSNWRFVGEEYAYSLIFSDPSPTQHFWSVAIEGQFYLVFPLLAVLALRLGGLSGFAVLGVLACSASVAATWLGFRGGAAEFRTYYGTDTRASELLVGVLLAAFLHTAAWARWRARSRAVLQGVGLACLASIAGAWCLVSLETKLLYQGGLTGYALLSAALLIASEATSGPVPALLSLRGLRWIGRISYAAYLIHWPVFMFVTPERTGLDAGLVFFTRVGCTLLLADLSGRLLERPIRRGRSVRGHAVFAVATVASIAVMASTVASIPRAWDDLKRLDLIGTGDRGVFSKGAAKRASVQFFGDSTALSLSLGTVRWLADNQLAYGTPGEVRLGCGVLNIGEFRAGGMLQNSQKCADVFSEWKDAIRTERPDLAVVLVGPWEVRSRRLSPEGPWLAPGDADFDAALRRALEQAMELLSEERQRSVWLTSPHIDIQPRDPRTASSDREASMPQRMDRLNELIREVAAGHRDWIGVVDFAEYMSRRKGGEFDPALRPDGVHFTIEGARSITDEWLGRAIIQSYVRGIR